MKGFDQFFHIKMIMKALGTFWTILIACRDFFGYEEKSLQAQIPPQGKASRKIPPEENPSQQNASTLKSLPAKHL